MKKFFSCLAIASLAFVGVLSSCQPEEIETTINPNSAEAFISVTVFNAFTAEDITAFSSITAASNLLGADVKVNNSQVVLTGNKEIVEQTITITASTTWAGETYSSSPVAVKINPLPAGGKAYYAATLIIGVPTEYSYREIKRELSEEVPGEFKPTHSESIAHDGHVYARNDTEYLLKTDVKFPRKDGTMNIIKPVEYAPDATEEEKTMVDTYAQLLDIPVIEETEETLPLTISAFSMYSVYAYHNYYTVQYGIYHKTVATGEDKLIGKINRKEITTSAYYEEKALPGHEAQYHYGHGHEDIHGYSSLAGGGIIWSD